MSDDLHIQKVSIPDRKPGFNKRSYNRHYWATNREEINAERRKQYASDSHERAKATARAQQRREPKRGLRKILPGIILRVEGREIEFLTIEQFAARIGKTGKTVRRFIQRGLLPRPHWTHPDNRARLFTVAQAEVVWGVMLERLSGARWPSERQDPVFYSRVRKALGALPQGLPPLEEGD